MPDYLSRKIALLGLLFFPVLSSKAQSKLSSTDSSVVYTQLNFIIQAPAVLPALLIDAKWDQMENFIENWKNAPIPNEELIFSIETLLAIQQNNFSEKKIPCDFFYYLTDYAKELNNIESRSSKFRYYVKVDFKLYYDATSNARETILFTQAWAKKLIATKQLDNTSLFFCKIFAGEIVDPYSYYQANKANLPTIAQFVNNLNEYNARHFIETRNKPTGTASIMMGCWIPTANLKTLGLHPSVGFQLGYRTKLNEYNFTCSIRFLYPTPHSYSFIQYDTLVTNNYYDGGYVGVDYTRYLLHTKYFEAGFTTGIGGDYFDMKSSTVGYSTLWSFNFNNGIRLKYFFHKHSFVGITAKYNLIHYNNPGGTDFNGNAFSIDFIYGSH